MSMIGQEDWSARSRITRTDRLIIAPIVGVVVFAFSIWLLPLYHSGDQRYYREFYRVAGSYDLLSAMKRQVYMVGSSEPVYGLVAWAGSRLSIDKDVYIAIFNVLLVVLMFFAIRAYRGGYIFFVLLLMGYYNLVLLTSAERLKFGYIVLFASLCAVGYPRVLLLFASIFGHFQMGVAAASLGLGQIAHARIFQRQTAFRLIYGVLAVGAIGGLSFLLVFLFGSQIGAKLTAYYRGVSLLDSANVGLLIGAGLLIYSRRWEFILSMVPSFAAVVALGASRSNMIAVTVFMILMVKDGKSRHPLVTGICMYFCFKSLGYVSNIIRYGDGFYGV